MLKSNDEKLPNKSKKIKWRSLQPLFWSCHASAKKEFSSIKCIPELFKNMIVLCYILELKEQLILRSKINNLSEEIN